MASPDPSRPPSRRAGPRPRRPVDLYWAGSGAVAVTVAVVVLLFQMVNDLRQDGVDRLERPTPGRTGTADPEPVSEPGVPGTSPGPSRVAAGSEVRRAVVRSRPEGVLRIRSLPSPLSETTGDLAEGDEVQVQCVLPGSEAIGPDGVRGDLWARVPGGYVPDVDLETAPGQPPATSCE